MPKERTFFDSGNRNQSVDDKLMPSVYSNPQHLLGGEWKRSGSRMVCRQHLLTDGRTSHDWGGSYIESSTPYLLHDGSTGEGVEIVKWWQTRRGLSSRREATEQIAALYGITLPDYTQADPMAVARAESRRKAREKALQASKATITTTAAASAIDYLHKRGLTDTEITDLQVAYIGKGGSGDDVAAVLQGGDTSVPLPMGFGSYYDLAAPVITLGAIVGYMLIASRRDPATTLPKYKMAKIPGAGSYVLGLGFAPGKKGHTARLVATEGLLDYVAAKRALKGTQIDVVALCRASVTADQAELIKTAGYTQILFAGDWEGDKATTEGEQAAGKTPLAKGVGQHLGAIESTAKALRAVGGLSMQVVDLMAGDMHRHADPDEFVNTYKTAADFADRVNRPFSVAGYLLDNIPALIADGDTSKIQADDRLRGEYRQRAAAYIAREDNTDERRVLIADAGDILGAPQQSLPAMVRAARKEWEQTLQAERQEAATERVHAALDSGGIAAAEKVLQSLKNGSKAQTPEDRERVRALTQLTAAEMLAQYRAAPKGIPTGWWFDIGTEHPFELVIPAGAITGISAPSTHGKTRMAENIICAVLEQWEKTGEKDKRVLYIHYEESDIDVIQHLANIHLNAELGYNNLDKIRDYLLTGSYYHNHPSCDLDRALDWVFAQRAAGRLDLAADIDSIEWIRAAVERGKDIGDLALVVIDYAQKVKSEGLRPGTDKKALMEIVCDDLNNIARDSMLPIVVTSQLNRQCNSPLDLSLNKNSDATNLEQTFNCNLLFWNSTFEPLTPPDFGKDRTAAKLMAAGYDFEGTPGKLVCKLGKNRGGQANVWGLLNINLNTGKITCNR